MEMQKRLLFVYASLWHVEKKSTAVYEEVGVNGLAAGLAMQLVN